jgi:hypothetical protein
MRKLGIGIILGVLGFYAYDKFRENAVAQQPAESAYAGQPSGSAPAMEVEYSKPPADRPRDTVAGRRCDGRVYCSQMTSCDEATWFLKNCPGVKMDGEGDGVPCESQWCGRR